MLQPNRMNKQILSMLLTLLSLEPTRAGMFRGYNPFHNDAFSFCMVSASSRFVVGETSVCKTDLSVINPSMGFKN